MVNQALIRRAGFVLISFVTLGSGAFAAGRDEAIPKDLRRLQDDLANLEADLRDLESGDPKTDAFRERAEEIGEDVVYLKVKMRRHQRSGEEGTGVALDEVSEVRDRIARLRGDIGSSFGQDNREMRLGEGTEIVVRLEDPLSSRTARREDRIEASVLSPVVLSGGAIAIPAGMRVRGVVRQVEQAERPSRPGRLEMEFDVLYLESQRLEMRAAVVAVGAGRKPAEKAGIGAVLGGVLGGLFDGKRGAIVGAIAGGAGAVVATRGDDVELPAGATLTLRLDQELVIPR